VDTTNILAGNWDNKIFTYDLINHKYIGSTDWIFRDVHRINAIYKDRHARRWIGSQRGFCIMNEAGVCYFPKGTFRNEEVFRIAQIKGDTLLVVTNGGFYFIKNNLNENLISVIREVSVPGANCVAITGEKEYLVGTSYGLLYVRDGHKTLMTIQDGMLSENINDIYFEPGSSTAWLATSEGLMQINLEILRKGNARSLEIQQVTLIQNDTSWLPHNADYLQV
jgi:ligand-binding sensor domain-containing protein